MNTAIIHSKLSQSTHFLRLSDAAGLLLLMALPHCDDYGRISADPVWWGLNVCPARKTVDQIEELLKEILGRKDRTGTAILTPYTVEGIDYLLFTKWFSYQGIGSNYVARAECPHPLLGIIEPNVMGKTLKDHFGKMDHYNSSEKEVQDFLDRGNKPKGSAKKEGKSSQIVDDSSQNDDESSTGLQRSDGDLQSTCEENGPICNSSSEHLPKNGPSNSQSHSQSKSQAQDKAHSHSPAQALAHSPEPPNSLETGPECASPPGVSLKSGFSGTGAPPTEGALALTDEIIKPDNPNYRPNHILHLSTDPESAEFRAARRKKLEEVEKSLVDRAAEREARRLGGGS